MKRALILGLALALVSCSKRGSEGVPTPTPKPTPSALTIALNKEIDDNDSAELRLEIRKFVTDYIKDNHPDYRVHGISLTRYSGDTEYDVRADVDIGSDSKIIQLRAWYFLEDDGNGYWKILENQ